MRWYIEGIMAHQLLSLSFSLVTLELWTERHPSLFPFLTCKTQTVTMLFGVVSCSCIRWCGVSLDHYMTRFFFVFLIIAVLAVIVRN